MRRFLRTLLVLGILALGGGAVAWLGCELAVEGASAGRCYDNLDRVPTREFGLLLGTSKYVAPGRENVHYRYRINAALELFKAGKVERILVSGNGVDPSYNEPRMMRDDLIAGGVPADRIVPDEGGLRTYDSVVRAAELFDARNCIVISQPSHNERAVFLGRARGQDIIAWNARPVGVGVDPRTAVRERLARVLAVYDALFRDPRSVLPAPPAHVLTAAQAEP